MEPAAPLARLAKLLVEQQRLAAGAAHDLHDQVGPTLTAIGFHLHALGIEKETAAELTGYLETAMEAARRASRELDPSPAGRLGLRGALEHFRESLPQPSIPIEIHQHPGPALPSGHVRTLYSMAVLALDNAITHSQASRISITIGSPESHYLLEITDDGCGFDIVSQSRAPSGSGLILLEAHAASISADLTIASFAGNGTIIRIRAV